MPSAMSRLASSSCTDALTISNAAPSVITALSESKRELIHLFTGAGVTLVTKVATDIEVRTMLRATPDEPNISSPAA